MENNGSDKNIFVIDDQRRRNDRDLDSASTTSSSDNNSINSEDETIVTYRTRWVVLAIFSLISMANAVIWISLSSISSIVKDYYSVSNSAVNWLAMIFSVMYIFVLLSAYCLNKYGLKFTILVGAVANAVASCLRLIGSGRDGFIYVLVGNGLAGLAQSFILFVPPTLAATWFSESERGTASAIGMLMNMLGVAVGDLMGGTMVPSSTDYDGEVKDGLFNSLFVQAVFCTLLVVISVIFVRRVPLTPPSMSRARLVRMREEKKMQKKLQKQLAKEREVQLTAYIHHANKVHNTGELYEYYDNTSKTQLQQEDETIGFGQSFKLLAKDKAFLLIMQAYGLYFGLYLTISTLLNQICTMHYPGMEQKISFMATVSVIVGLVALFCGGLISDKTRRYKLISTLTFACCAVSLLAFFIVLDYVPDFNVTFVCYCVFGFFSYPFMSVGLEYAAEVTYPIPEGITSGILLLVANMYGIVFTNILQYVLDNYGTQPAGYILVALYGLGVVVCLLTKGKLKRYEADRASLNSSCSSGSVEEQMEEEHVNQAFEQDKTDVCVV